MRWARLHLHLQAHCQLKASMKREGKSAAIAALKGDPIGQADGVFALMSQAAIATHRAVQGIQFATGYIKSTTWSNPKWQAEKMALVRALQPRGLGFAENRK